MEYKDKASIIVEKQVRDNYGGYSMEEEVLCEIKVIVAPYRVEVGEICVVPNPLASVKFFTNSKLDFDEDTNFFIMYKNKKYKKVSFADYGKCVLIIGERIC